MYLWLRYITSNCGTVTSISSRSIALAEAFFVTGAVTAPVTKNASARAMDRELMEVTVPQLEVMYRSHKYMVTQVVQWYLARIEKYNGVYRAVQHVDARRALETAAREDADAKA